MRFFNTAGPCKIDDHYTIPPLERFDLDDVLMLIEQKKYFVLHAPRQTGKQHLCWPYWSISIRGIGIISLYTNVEVAQAARDNVAGGISGIKAILADLASKAKNNMGDDFIHRIQHQVFKENNEYFALNQVLTLWSGNSARPVVLIIDEIDALVEDKYLYFFRGHNIP